MAGSGRISLLIDSPLRTLAHAMRGLDGDVKREIGKRTKPVAEAAWREELQGEAGTRMESRLAQSGTVGVTAQNVFLRAGVGALSSGTALSDVTSAIGFGASADKLHTVRSRKGTQYKRRMADRFKAPRRRGYVAYPAARSVIPRMASLWAQTAARTIHETIEKVG